MIYVIKTKNTDPAFIKIGYAKKSISGRMKSLKTGCPYELELIYAKNGGLKEERILHEKLKNHRVVGEWFAWNEVTRKEFDLKENPAPLNPDSPRTFLTPRQKQLNHLFRKSASNENFLYVQTLELFLKNHIYTAKDLAEFPKGKERFVVFESTAHEVSKHFGAVQSVLNSTIGRNEKQLFISAEDTIDWKIKPEPNLPS